MTWRMAAIWENHSVPMYVDLDLVHLSLIDHVLLV